MKSFYNMGFSKLYTSSKFLKHGFGTMRQIVRSCTNVHKCGTSQEYDSAGKPEGGGDKNQDTGGKRGLVLGVYEEKDKFVLSSLTAEADQKFGGKISQQLNEVSCRLKLGSAVAVSGVSEEYSVVALTSLGPADATYCSLEGLQLDAENIRWGVGAGVNELKARGVGAIHVDPGALPAAAAEGATLANWRFQEFKSCEDREPTSKVSVHGTIGGDEWHIGEVYGDAQNWARYLSDMPANKMTPVDVAQNALNVLCPLGVRVFARERSWIEAQNMEAFLAVARGSCEEPIFLECVYDGANTNQSPVLLAAKGVTFDSGGLCLKHPSSMVENRGSMSGAAVVLATLKILAELKVPINVRAVIPLCENMVSGQCMKVGDVVRALNGLSIQIENTDMEGRLMLADALVYGQAAHRPSLVVDVATLTHGVLLATGGGAFGCFTNNDEVWHAVRQAGALTGDRAWRLPLWAYYHQQITNEAAVDLRNQGSGKASPCLGAAFLRNFVCGDWVHMDITGVGKLAHSPAPPYLNPRHMTGRPTRTLASFLSHIACRQELGEPLDKQQRGVQGA